MSRTEGSGLLNWFKKPRVQFGPAKPTEENKLKMKENKLKNLKKDGYGQIEKPEVGKYYLIGATAMKTGYGDGPVGEFKPVRDNIMDKEFQYKGKETVNIGYGYAPKSKHKFKSKSGEEYITEADVLLLKEVSESSNSTTQQTTIVNMEKQRKEARIRELEEKLAQCEEYKTELNTLKASTGGRRKTRKNKHRKNKTRRTRK